MAKISTYPVDGLISTDDFIIGSDAENVNITKNFTVGGILSLANLQMVLNNGNSATQNITLVGSVAATNVSATTLLSAPTGNITTVGATTVNATTVNATTANATNANVNGSLTVNDLEVSGLFYDSTASEGTIGQILKSTGSGVEWFTFSETQNLQAVLTSGNTTSLNIVSTGDITADAINANAVEADDYTVNSQLSITGTIEADGSIGTAGQVLVSQGGAGSVEWATITQTQDLQSVLDNGNSATEDIVLTGTVEAITLTVNSSTPGTIDGKGDIVWSQERGTIEVGLVDNNTMNVGQDTIWLARANSAIAKGEVVYAYGTVGASGKIVVDKYLADGSIPSRYIIGVAIADINVSEEGYVMSLGKIKGVDTSTYSEGDVLWCDPAVAGGLTNVEPTAPDIKSAMAFVISVGNNGTIAVRTDNGFVISDASDVNFTGVADGDVILRAGGVWTNITPSADLIATPSGAVDPLLTQAAAITDVIGLDAGQALSTPSQWLTITINSVNYVIPAYLSA
jgi:hypothetical protein